MPAEVRQIVVEDASALAEEASSLLLAWLSVATSRSGLSRVVLAGGGTPRTTYRLLTVAIRGAGIPVDRLEWLFGDERWVAVADPQSNEGMARETLLGPVGAPESSIRSWLAGEGEPSACAARYDRILRASPGSPEIVLLGVGADGHTASLFPASTLVLPDGTEAPIAPRVPGGFAAAAVRGGGAPGWRLTLCPEYLASARHVLFLASGAEKAQAVRAAVDGAPLLPAAWVRGRTTTFIVTRDTQADRVAEGGRR